MFVMYSGHVMNSRQRSRGLVHGMLEDLKVIFRSGNAYVLLFKHCMPVHSIGLP